MKYYIYKLTDPNGKSYVGVTNNVKRRMKEHRSSSWPIGVALREIGEKNFTLIVEEFETRDMALEREFELVSLDTVKDMYNVTVGGNTSTQMTFSNPMFNPEVVNNHKGTWTSTNNPMKDPTIKAKMVASQKRKPVSVDGVVFNGVREAGRALGISRQLVVFRLKSDSFPSWFYL